MPTYHRFEDLPVWKSAADLYDLLDDFLHRAPSRMRPSFRDQLERAGLSISNNIAEGFERGTTKEVLTFLYISRGSAGEVRSMLRIADRRPWMTAELRGLIEPMVLLAESCSRQLRAWAGALQETDIRGQRHLNQEMRETFRQRRK